MKYDLNLSVRSLFCVTLAGFICFGKQHSGGVLAVEPTITVKAMLGDPMLTAGIPGKGPLTPKAIKAFMADATNHQVLTVRLPQGLDAGAKNVYIPDDNLLTLAKIELGRQLYFDKRLSSDNTVSCADCHHPQEGYARHTQFGVGIRKQTGGRNSPVSYNRLLSKNQFWDGRAGSLEAQAVGPIASPIEMGNTHEEAIKTIQSIRGYGLQFNAIFKDGINIDNVGKAIASFERVIVTGPSAYDYAEPLRVFKKTFAEELEDLKALQKEDPLLYGKYQALFKAAAAKPMSASAKRGRELFFSKAVNCSACHTGANFTDEKFHNIGVGMDRNEPDPGRYAVTKNAQEKGAFKTPTLRNVATSAPYMHDGSQKTLAETVEWYNRGGHPNPHLSKDIRKLNLKDQGKSDLVEFMKALTGEFPKVNVGRLPR